MRQSYLEVSKMPKVQCGSFSSSQVYGRPTPQCESRELSGKSQGYIMTVVYSSQQTKQLNIKLYEEITYFEHVIMSYKLRIMSNASVS